MHNALQPEILGTQQHQIPNRKMYVPMFFVAVALLYCYTLFHLHTCLTPDFLCPLQKFREGLDNGRLVPFQQVHKKHWVIPYIRKKRLYPRILLGSELTTISMVGKNSLHPPKSGTSLTRQQSVCETMASILSTWSWLKGWYAVPYFSFVPSKDQISCHHLPINNAPRLEWIAWGTPCNFTTCYQYNLAASPIVVLFFHGMIRWLGYLDAMWVPTYRAILCNAHFIHCARNPEVIATLYNDNV